ncbi:MAG TPA: hypothetical protein VLG49_07225, partial [Rhabdochlamydiaceae bacterium]|nr:hypothetical protein [Rhabdochlamydiaceae bacterium]
FLTCLDDLMRKADFFLHSPFSLSLTAKEENKVLLLQFILSDLFSAFHFNKENSFDLIFSPEPFFYPYDWSLRIGYLNKIQEHSVLLSQAFELLEEPLILFNQALEKAISRCRIPNVIQKLVLGNAGATDLQQAMPVPKQGMCKHMSDAGGCKDEDAGAAQN